MRPLGTANVRAVLLTTLSAAALLRSGAAWATVVVSVLGTIPASRRSVSLLGKAIRRWFISAMSLLWAAAAPAWGSATR